MQRNSVSPQEDIFKDYNMKSRTHVLNPKYSTPTSLPLYFYYVYQLLQESNSLKKYGPVSWDICILWYEIYPSINYVYSFCFFLKNLMYRKTKQKLKLNKNILMFFLSLMILNPNIKDYALWRYKIIIRQHIICEMLQLVLGCWSKLA